MKRFFLLPLLLLISTVAFSQKIDLKTANKSINNDKTEIIDKNSFRIYLPIQFIELNDNSSKNGNFVDLKSPLLIRSFNVGNPNLPLYSKLIEVPQGAIVETKIISYDEETIDLNNKGIKNKIYPAQASVSKSSDPKDNPFEINKKVYNTDAFWGNNNIVVYEEQGQMRSQRLGTIQINPIKYNPVTNQLKIYNNIVVSVTFKNADWTKTNILKKKYASPFFETKNKDVINQQKSDSKALIQATPVTYVIVSDPSFESALQPFVEWKKQKGFHVIEAYTNEAGVGTTVVSIKSYLKNLYNNPASGVNPPSFILLVGDVDKIPATRHTEVDDSPWSDIDYAEYTGDYLPEVYYGRFPADNSTDVTNMVSKTIKYEKYQMADPNYLKQTLLVAGDEEDYEDTYGGGAIWYADNYYLNSENEINSHTFLQKVIETWGGNTTGNLRAHDSIIANINSGVALANYTAHCGPSGWSIPSFSNSDLSSISNVEKYGLWIGNCCQSNKFDENDAFGEIALKKANAGAIGYIGGSQYTYWSEDYYWGVGLGSIVEEPDYNSTGLGVYDGMFHSKTNESNNISKWYITSAQMIKSGNLAVQASSSGLKAYYWVIYHLMGDPSLMPYIGIPDALNVVINTTDIIIGSTTITGNSSPYAYIALTQDNELIGVAQADENGDLNFTLSRALTGSQLDIVGTAQFKQAYFNSITPVATDQPYVMCDSVKTPELTNGLSGKMSIYLKNYGDTGNDASNVHVYFHSNDPLITIVDSVADVSTIIAGETIFLADTFSYILNDYIEDQYTVPIIITTKDAANTIVNSTKYLTINAPSFTSIKSEINDVPDTISIVSTPKETVEYGTEYNYNIQVAYPSLNGQLDVGEDVVLTFQTTNNGHTGIGDLYAQLTTNSPDITITTNVYKHDTLIKGNTLETNFTINVSDANSDIYEADFEYVFGDTTYQDTLKFTLSVNLINENFESGDLKDYNWHTNGDAEWFVTSDKSYNEDYSVVSGNIGNSQATNLFLYLSNIEDGQKMSFYYNVSSEQNYDFLEFWVNDTRIARWSGSINWTKYEYTFSSDGDYKIEFRYTKDESESIGSDCAWIDYISFPVLPSTSKKDASISLTAPTKPSWLNFTDNNDGTALLTGTAPSSDFDETIRIVATDGTLNSYQEYTLKVRVVTLEETEIDVDIFPNPTSDFLNIQINDNFKTSSIIITDLSGKIVKNDILLFNKNSIDVSVLEKGIYFLKLNIDNKSNYYKIIVD